MAAAFEAADFQFAIFPDGEETIGHGHVRILLGREKDDIAVDGLDRQREPRSLLDLFGQPFVVLARRSFFPNIERVHQGV